MKIPSACAVVIGDFVKTATVSASGSHKNRVGGEGYIHIANPYEDGT